MKKLNPECETKSAKVLKEIMLEKNLTQLKLAEILGVRQSQISNWLSGKTVPTYTSLQILKDNLDVPVEIFFL